MAQICPNCKSADTMTQVRSIQCLNCGKVTPVSQLPQPTSPE